MTTNESAQSTFWLSFADGHRPAGSQFLGVVLVDAYSLSEALTDTHRAGCNPGGEVQSFEITPDVKRLGPPDEVLRVLALPRLTLLSREQLTAAGVEI